MRRALVVAHPDDESLWFGGLLIAEPAEWHVFCASTPRVDPERAFKLMAACERLGARSARISSITESPANAGFDRLDERIPDLSGYDQIVTHNAVGEYGHVQHTSLHRWLTARYPGKVLTGRYGMDPGPKRIALTPDQFERKMQALRCYDHVSPTDGKPKWQALVERYGKQFDLAVETYG